MEHVLVACSSFCNEAGLPIMVRFKIGHFSTDKTVGSFEYLAIEHLSNLTLTFYKLFPNIHQWNMYMSAVNAFIRRQNAKSATSKNDVR
jgi:hypothetical protein